MGYNLNEWQNKTILTEMLTKIEGKERNVILLPKFMEKS